MLVTEPQIADFLASHWIEFNDSLMEMRRETIEKAIELELRGSRRTRILSRLHARFSKLRTTAERKQLVELKTEWKL